MDCTSCVNIDSPLNLWCEQGLTIVDIVTQDHYTDWMLSAVDLGSIHFGSLGVDSAIHHYLVGNNYVLG